MCEESGFEGASKGLFPPMLFPQHPYILVLLFLVRDGLRAANVWTDSVTNDYDINR